MSSRPLLQIVQVREAPVGQHRHNTLVQPTLLRTDVFCQRKSIHLNIDKQLHAAFRSKLFFQDVSMQAAFEEFARAYVNDDVHAAAIMDGLVLRVLGLKVEMGMSDAAVRAAENKRISELDVNSIYDLIDRGSDGSVTIKEEGDAADETDR